MSSQVQKVKSRLSSRSNTWQSHHASHSFIFVKFTPCHRPNSAVASDDCARDHLHKDHCAQAFGRNTLSKPHSGWSIALTDGQGIPDHVNTPSEQYNGIARMICAVLAEGQHTDPDKSVLMWAGVKLDHPETYAGGSDLEEFEVFIAGILRWLKMNCLLGETSVEILPRHLPYRWGARMVLQKCRTIWLPGPWVDLGNSSAGTAKEIPAYLDTPSCVK